jgi:ribosome-associated protein
VHAVQAALDKQAAEPAVLDLRGLSDVTDFFLICHGNSERQVLAIVDAVEERLRKELNLRPSHVEGRRTADWILMDYVDLVVHVFRSDRREFYRLERLWGDAPALDVEALAGPSAGPTDAQRRSESV